MRSLNLGIVGAARRGGSLQRACEALGSTRIQAVCDVDEEGLNAAKERLRATEAYLSYEEMLRQSDIDAVIIGTPMPLHVPQAISALARGVHVLSEVPAGVSIEECRRLVEACKESSAIYMMAENYVYSRPNQIVKGLAREGLFGTIYYAEGEYLHDLKKLNETTTWRRKWQTGINGVTYPTHSLGPVLQWMEGDRVVSVCCAGSGHHYTDPRGRRYENEDSCVMLCKMRSGGLVKIRVDMLSDRPHAMTNFQLQGTDGAYESARAPGERDRIWLRSFCKEQDRWIDLEELADEFMPEAWRVHGDLAVNFGHGGGDLLQMANFIDVVVCGLKPEIGVHEAMDMTLPGLVSQQSIVEGGRWMDVPDSRQW